MFYLLCFLALVLAARCSSCLVLFIFSLPVTAYLVVIAHTRHDISIKVDDERLAACGIAHNVDQERQTSALAVVVLPPAFCQITAKHSSCCQHAAQLYFISKGSDRFCETWTKERHKTSPPVLIIDRICFSIFCINTASRGSYTNTLKCSP